jgi:hypothetical protein
MEQQERDLLIKLNTKVDSLCSHVNDIDKKIDKLDDKLADNVKDQTKSCSACKDGIFTEIGKKVNWTVFIVVMGVVLTLFTILVPYAANTREKAVRNSTLIQQHIAPKTPTQTIP